ncbi:MAG: CHC2 zinc finger domain-containing protein, partial [Candidatus Omnitrophota bacterium]
MAGLIPDNVLEDILSRVNIVELIGGYIPLKRAGRNFRANCPFHHEKTPSFMVSADRQIYHCFGCGAGGNAFNFLIQYERLEFREAVEMLAKKVGVELPSDNSHNARAASLSTATYKVNEFAAFYYQNNLNLPVAQAAKSYLLKRGLKEDT